MNTIVITGSSSGIGKATAKYFAEKGWRVAATMRSPEKESELKSIDNINLYKLDVSDENSIKNATSKILDDYGNVDIVLNNAGYALAGAFEASTPLQVQKQFDVNVFGLMSVTKAFIPHFREKKSGMFINVSSLSGLTTFPFNSLYHASKWAVEGFSESLSYEMSTLGIKVKLIEPGSVDTNFGGSSMDFCQEEPVKYYKERIFKYKENLSKRDAGTVSPQLLAETIFDAANDQKDKLRYLVGKTEEVVELRKAKGSEGFVSAIMGYMY